MRSILAGKRYPAAAALLLAVFGVLAAYAPPSQARTMQARIDKVTTPVATLHGVRVRLHWPQGAPTGQLRLQAAHVVAADLGYRWNALDWRCVLQRDDGNGWRCAGAIRGREGRPLHLDVALGPAGTEAMLSGERATLSLSRVAATPDLSRVELTQVPVAWAQALLRSAWADAALTGGTLGGHVDVDAAKGRPLRVSGILATNGLSLETADATIAAEGVDGRFDFDYRKPAGNSLVTVEGEILAGDALFGNTFLSLSGNPVGVQVDGVRRAGQGWELPRFEWRDAGVLVAEGTASFDADAALRDLELRARSPDLSPVAARYLSGQLALAGLSDVALGGAASLDLSMRNRMLANATLGFDQVSLRDAADRFGFQGLDGEVRHVAEGQADSMVSWRGGQLYGLDFGAARLPLRSTGGVIGARAAIVVPMAGGTLRFDDLRIRPPSGGEGLDVRFSLDLDAIDFGRVAKAVGLPDFQGELYGHIPQARYANERLDFEGGLSMQLFDGQVQVSAMSLERPFGTAPSLNADIAFNDLDLLRLTEVLDFGSIDGRLDGEISGLRLVDWTPVAFDARLATDADAARRHGAKQRISQRAVQNISSVGDASFATSLQGRLIGLFDDFRYARIGIGCRLANEVCRMSGIEGERGEGSGAPGFTIVQGRGLPRLDVVGHNRDVDWPTLVERLAAVGAGETKPVIE